MYSPEISASVDFSDVDCLSGVTWTDAAECCLEKAAKTVVEKLVPKVGHSTKH